jgi:soluble lytic murein transglycosylase-like protein
MDISKITGHLDLYGSTARKVEPVDSPKAKIFTDNLNKSIQKWSSDLSVYSSNNSVETFNPNRSSANVSRPSSSLNSISTSSPASGRNISVNEPVSFTSKFDSLINRASDKYNLPADLLKKVIQTESNFDPNVVSSAGAQGLMQLMPATAKWLGVTNPFDPAQNIEGGSKYLHNMLDKYNGDVTLALAAYNAGPGNVDKFGGVPPFEETQNYIKKILS